MAKDPVLEIIRQYLRELDRTGIRVRQAILYGSWARGDTRLDSDIDLVVISPQFDDITDRDLIDRLWEITALVPEAWRIEPIACGERQWLEDDTSPILEIARREGEVIAFEPEAA
jgi:predicted nucleotidyltransferase